MLKNKNKPETWTQEFLDQKRLVGDPDADRVIAELIDQDGQNAARELFDRLIQQIDIPVNELPQVLRDFVNDHNELTGVTKKQVDNAQDFFEDHGPKFLLFLYFKSLPILYSCANGAQVLASTGRLSRDQDNMEIFSRRIAETGQFLLYTMSKGGLKPGTTGIRAILKVRLIHAAIRAFLKQKNWDIQKLGEPVNQEDMAITLLTFSLSLVEALETLEIDEPVDRNEDFFATWCAIGRLLGLDEALIPENLQEARILKDRILDRQSRESDAGKLLTRALILFTEEAFRNEHLKNLPQLLIRFLTGDQIANNLGVIKNRIWLVRLVIYLLRLFFNFVERIEDANESIHKIVDRIANKLISYMVNYFDKYKKKTLVVNDRLIRKWNVTPEE